MKRLALACTATMFLLVVAVAPAQGKAYQQSGTIAGGGTITFVVKTAKNKKGKFVPKTAGNFHVTGQPVTCDDISGNVNYENASAKVPVSKKGKFRYDFTAFTASISGKVTSHGKHGTGQASYGPATVSGHTGCTSNGAHGWTT